MEKRGYDRMRANDVEFEMAESCPKKDGKCEVRYFSMPSEGTMCGTAP